MSGLAPIGAGSGGASPRDFRDEVACELRAAYSELACDRARIAALEELERLTIELTGSLRKPLTVFDVIEAAADRHERERRLALVRELRRDT